MSTLFLLLSSILLSAMFFCSSPMQAPEPSFGAPEPSVQAPEPCSQEPAMANVSTSNLTGNPIDDCWRNDQNWDVNRQHLANCVVGFAENAKGGQNGSIYNVTDENDEPGNPQPGTLRYGAIQDEPLWIIFARDMLIKLQKEILIRSSKTIDGRGVNVHLIGERTCLYLENVTNIIVHGIHIHDCNDDGITIAKSSHVWVDHCSLSNCSDGLIDVNDGSTAITISNNYFTHHDKVMLLGSGDRESQDKDMQVTVAFNHFGEGAHQRMPRCRFGYFHVVNNDYTHWEGYAIGGSADPTINSQGNRFLCNDGQCAKEVTMRMDASPKVWKTWNWRSVGDLFLNDTHFIPSGSQSPLAYDNATSLLAQPASEVPKLTRDAGVLHCTLGNYC